MISETESARQVIQASAGSGKTTKLTNIFIALLLAGESPERILATTFTRKAASEIRTKIFERLAKAAVSQEELEKLVKLAEIPRKVTQPEIRDLLCALIMAQHRLAICTIDSLFIRIAQSFSHEIGLPPKWGIARSDDTAVLKDEAIREVLQEYGKGDLFTLFQMVHRGEFRRSIYEELRNITNGLHSLYRSSTEAAWAWIPVGSALDSGSLAEFILKLEGLVPAKTQKGIPSEKFQSTLRRDLTLARSGEWENFIAAGLGLKILAGELEFSRIKIPPEYFSVYEPLIQQARHDILSTLLQKTKATYALLDHYDHKYMEQILSQGMLSFSDLKHILARASSLGELEEVYYRLDCRYHHLLLDEFQDTSDDDWALLEPMAAEILSKATGEHSFFCVGDQKQAIYGWRGGRAEIIDEVSGHWDLSPSKLVVSYRSAPPIIKTVNSIFEQVASNPILSAHVPVCEEWMKRFEVHSVAPAHLGMAGEVEIFSVAKGAEKGLVAFETAAAKVWELAKAAPNITIGVLVPRNASVARMISLINREGSPVVASEEGGNPLTDSVAVLTLLSLLLLVDHPQDEIAHFHVATSPIGVVVGITLEQNRSELLAVLTKIRAHLFHHGYGESLSAWVKGLASSYHSDREQRRLWQLVELGMQFDSDRGTRARDFVALVKGEKVEDPSGSRVRVMNIHQSKGLEFDAVVLPDCDRDLFNKPRDLAIWGRRGQKGSIEQIARYASAKVRSLSPELAGLWAERRNEELKEALCVLYVALTRAKRAMYVVTEEESFSRGVSFASIIRASLAPGVLGPGVLYKVGDTGWINQFDQELRTESAADFEKGPESISFASNHKRLYPQIPIVSPSRHSTGHPRSKVELGASPFLARGIALHKLFEQVEWIKSDADIPNADLCQNQLKSIGVTISVAKDLANEFIQMLKMPGLAQLFRIDNYGPKTNQVSVYRELPFSYRKGSEIVSGVIDRLIVIKKDNEVIAAEVIDYKSDRISAQEIASRLDEYRAQVREYREAAALFAGIPINQVAMKIALLQCGEVKEL